jgi:hypothetical protein
MRNQHVSGFKLIVYLAGGLALLAANSVSAGLVFTKDAITDFSFDGAVVRYYPTLAELKASPDTGYQLNSTPGHQIEERLYFSSEAGGGTPELRFDVTRVTPGSAPSTKTLLSGVTTAMETGPGSGGFHFLVKDGVVDGSAFPDFKSEGIFVGVSGLTVSELDTIQPIMAPDPTGMSSAGGLGPLPAPAPGSLALLLAAGIPLFLTRRRA